MNELIVHLGNCIILGEDFTKHPDGSEVRDAIRLEIDGKNLVLRQNREIIKNFGKQNYNGMFVESSSLHFLDATKQEIPVLLDLSDRLCEMLSFATGSKVVRYEYGFSADGDAKHFQSVIGSVETHYPVFGLNDGSAYRRFVEQCYPLYTLNRDSRKLHIVFGYLHHAGKSGVPLELKLASLFIALESLKHSYAVQQNYPSIKGYFREHSATEESPGKSLGFEVLLTRMFSDVGMSSDMNQIILLRNELIHSGLIGNEIGKNLNLFKDIQNIIREYILRLLGFAGAYHCCSRTGTKTII